MAKTMVPIFQEKILIPVALAILSLGFATGAIRAFQQSSVTEQTHVKNTIEEDILLDYAAQMRPSTLYPHGGDLMAKDLVLTGLLDQFQTLSEVKIMAQEPLEMELRSELSYQIQTKDLWQSQPSIMSVKVSRSEPTTQMTLSHAAHLDFGPIYDFIQKVDEETQIRANTVLVLNLHVTGTLSDLEGQMVHPVDQSMSLPFELAAPYVRYVGTPESKVKSTTTILTEKVATQPGFHLFGITVPLLLARIAFSLLALLAMGLALLQVWHRRLHQKEQRGHSLASVLKVENKNKSKILTVPMPFSLEREWAVPLNSLQDLVTMAEDKEEKVFKYIDATGTTYYLITPTVTFYCVVPSLH